MASLINKRKKGHLYTYWVESARVDGKPRIVEQVYLGPKERVMAEIKAAYTRGRTAGPSPLKRVRHLEFGASAWLWHWAEKLGLVQLVDRHVPPVQVKRRTLMSVGQYLVLAALNRAIEPRSKRAFYEFWYQNSVVSRLWPAPAEALNSQRFWDHMDPVQSEHIQSIQQDLLERLHELFPIGSDTVLYDTTHYFTFIDTFNQRTELAQRGNNKQKRHDLRQLSLALFEDEQTGLPLYHQVYAGNRNDVSQFPDAWPEMVRSWMKSLERPVQQLTLVFDKGNVSRANVGQLEKGQVRYVAALPSFWVSELLGVPLSDFRKLTLAGTKHLKVHRCRRPFWGKERTLLVVFSPSFYRRQRAAMNRLQLQVEQQLRDLGQSIAQWREQRSGKGFTEASVRRKITQWTGRDHLHEFLIERLELEGDRVMALTWSWDLSKKREVQRRYLGKTVLLTDHEDWEDAVIVLAYRKLWKNEYMFRISKGGPWWPMFHWTDSKMRVHALYCHFALLLLAILKIELNQAGITLSVDRCIDRLRNIQETLVIYTNGAGERILSDRDELQERLLEALGLRRIAEQMGTTVTNPD